MTLKEILRYNLTCHLSDEKTEVDVLVAAKIAEEFAIGFAEWIRVCKLKQRPYNFDNTKELLKTYKQEKEL